MKNKIKKDWKFNSSKVKYVPMGTITKSHYTKFDEHPEDRIFRDREYIQRLQKHIDSVYETLATDLRLNEQGTDWLFDYVFNEDNKDIEFEEYLEKYNVKYCDIVK
jgi:hypothetical protein